MKVCPVCEEPFEPRHGGRPQTYCKTTCRSKANYQRRKNSGREAKRRERYATDTEYREIAKTQARRGRLKQLFGMTPEDYERIFASQGNRCAICRTEDARFVIDPDHRTGRVRGILCRKCNAGLGMFGDKTSALKSAVKYLDYSLTRSTVLVIERKQTA